MKICKQYAKHKNSISTMRLNFCLLLIMILIHEIHSQENVQNGFRNTFPNQTNESPKSDEWFLSDADIEDGTSNQILSGQSAIIDSIIEYRNFGYPGKFYRWYYHYNSINILVNSRRLQFNLYNEFEDITEIRNYDSKGHVIRYTLQEPIYKIQPGYNDSTIIDAEIIENVYDDDKLVQVTRTIWNSYQDIRTEQHSFYYDDTGMLIRSIEDYGGDEYFESEYLYYPDNILEYRIRKAINYGYCTVWKYTYEKTDTSLKTLRYFDSYNTIDLLPDTITYWHFKEEFYETLDGQGRRTSMFAKSWNYIYGEKIDYKADYGYTESDKLLYASYYKLDGTLDTGVWQETMRINNTYDEDDNILFYEKTYYDDRSGNWEIDENRSYYYSIVTDLFSNEIIDTDELYIYPNPATNTIMLPGIGNFDCTYTIISLQGIILKNATLKNGSIPVAYLKPGVYILKIHKGSGTLTGRFVKI